MRALAMGGYLHDLSPSAYGGGMVVWMADAPWGWKSRDGRFRLWANGSGWVLWDGASVVEVPGGAGVVFERVTQAKLAAAIRMLRG